MKTAIDELIEQFEKRELPENWKEYFIEKEKQQIIDAVTHGNRMEFYDATETAGEQYYNKTYGS